MTWNEMQTEIHDWARQNFGTTPPGYLLCGLLEEIGEYLACVPDGVLNLPDVSSSEYLTRRVLALDAIADQAVYVLNMCELCGVDFGNRVVGNSLNSPNNYTDRELLGALALAARAVLKNFQGIRGYTWEKRRSEVEIGVSIWWRWAQDQHRKWTDNPILATVEGVWHQVRKRDWRKDPDRGGT